MAGIGKYVLRASAALFLAAVFAQQPVLADARGTASLKKAKDSRQQAAKRKKPASPEPAIEEEAPSSISNLANSRKVSQAVTETEIVVGRDERPMLSTGSAIAISDAIARYETITARGNWAKVELARFKVGTEYKAAVPLKRRLAAEGFYPAQHADNPLVTENMEKALAQFQINYGLAATGKLDKQTVAALNVPVSLRLAALRANLPRVEEYARDIGPRYILVNIPALQLEAVNGTSVFSRHNIIVGKPDRPSPVVMTDLSDINFNPYWNAPVSIVEKDIIPEVRKKGTGVLKQMGIRIFEGYSGPEVDPDTVNWNTVTAERYFFRQDPGEENAMAAVKINFPSPFGVYMHDTPTRSLFTTGARYLSSGCVRVDKVQILVDWILNGQDGWNASRIEAVALAGERQDVKLTAPPQIRWVYLTAWASADGQVNFRNDIYDLDDTGFVVGQPMPVGEYAEDGRRFFETAPVKQAAVAPLPEELPEAGLPAPEPEVKPEAPAKRNFGKPLTEKPKTAEKRRPRAAKAASVADKPKKQGNFNKPPAPVAGKKKKVASKVKPPAAKANPVVQKNKAPAKAVAEKDAKKKAPAKAVAEVDSKKKAPAKAAAATGVKKKKPVQNIASDSSGAPVFGAQ